MAESSKIVFRSVARRKTDLMPTIPSPRDVNYGSRSSLSNTPRTSGRAYSLNRLDQLAKPIRRFGEHICAIFERERSDEMEMLNKTESLRRGRDGTNRVKKNNFSNASTIASMSRSLTYLSGNSRPKYSLGGGISSSFCPLGRDRCDESKSMIQLSNSWSNIFSRPKPSATKKYPQTSLVSSVSKSERVHQHYTNPKNYDLNSLLLINSNLIVTGSRSGNVTPRGNMFTSRPGSAMSTSTTLSTSGYVTKKPAPVMRKPRPASIAGTDFTSEEFSKIKKENMPPMKASQSKSAQTTPKRTSNVMSTSLVMTPSLRMSNDEKKNVSKREPFIPKASTPKTLLKTSSCDRLNKPALMKSNFEIPSSVPRSDVGGKNSSETIVKSKDEKNAFNSVKTEKTVTHPTMTDVNEIAENKIPTPVLGEKFDQGNEKDHNDIEIDGNQNFSNDNQTHVEYELILAETESSEHMSASMIARNKITTEEEAKAALAERRRLAREEAERQTELERQRLEAERYAEFRRQEEETERQRQFEEEAIRLAEEQRMAETERLHKAIEEAKHRDEEEQRKRDEEEQQRLDRDEAEKRAKEEAEKQRIEVAERLKREEKEREERRKRVEAIMSRTRKNVVANTSNSTSVKEIKELAKTSPYDAHQSHQTLPASSEISSTSSLNTTTSTPILIPNQASVGVVDQQNTQAMYEQSVIEKEPFLTESFSSMIIDENSKEVQKHSPQEIIEDDNSKSKIDQQNSETLIQNTTIKVTSVEVANGNSHIENYNNKNDIISMENVVTPVTNQLFNICINSSDINNPINMNNNSLLSTTTLVNVNSQENTDISLM